MEGTTEKVRRHREARQHMATFGPIHVDGDSILIGAPDGSTNWRFWGVHIEVPWSQCVRDFDAARRAYLHLGPVGTFIVGLPTRDSDTGRWHLDGTQAWTPRLGWRSGRYSALGWHPPPALTCTAPVGEPVTATRGPRTGTEIRSRCGAWRWHRGPHSGT